MSLGSKYTGPYHILQRLNHALSLYVPHYWMCNYWHKFYFYKSAKAKTSWGKKSLDDKEIKDAKNEFMAPENMGIIEFGCVSIGGDVHVKIEITSDEEVFRHNRKFLKQNRKLVEKH